MAEKFDPYYTWLGIPPEDQPPDHYALIGVRQFESNPDVISNLTDQRMAHVKTFQAGPHGADSQKLLNEIAAARVCLLNPERRKAYDAKLRGQIAVQTAPQAPPLAAEPETIAAPPVAPPASTPQSDSVSDAFAFIAATARPVAARGDRAVKEAIQSRAKQRARARWLFIGAPILGIAMVVIAITVRNSQDADDVAPVSAPNGVSTTPRPGGQKSGTTGGSPSAEPSKVVGPSKSGSHTKSDNDDTPKEPSQVALKPSQNPAPSGGKVPETVTSVPSPPVEGTLPPNQFVDLVSRFDPVGGHVEGDWTKSDGAIASPVYGNWSRVMLPVKLEGEFDLTVAFTRQNGDSDVVFFFPVGQHAVALSLSNWSGQHSSLWVGERAKANNTVERSPGTLIKGHKYTLEISVRIDGPKASIDVSLDGSPYLNWHGDEESLPPRFEGLWQIPDAKRLGLGSHFFVTTFHSVQLRMVSGKATWIGGAEKSSETAKAQSGAARDAPPPAGSSADSGLNPSTPHPENTTAGESWAARATALIRSGSSVKTPSERAELMRSSLKLFSQAKGAERWSSQTSELVALAETVGRQTNESELIAGLLRAPEERIRRERTMAEGATAAQDALAKNPDDPGANTIVGRFLCLQMDNWAEGLPHLAKGSDFSLTKIANLEQSPPSDPAGKFKLANSWWDVANKRIGLKPNPWLEPMEARAAYWYRKCVSGVAGAELTTAQKRIAEQDAVANELAALTDGQFPFPLGQSIDVLRFVDTNSGMVVAGNWSRNGQEITVEPGLFSRIAIPISVKGSYDLEVDFTRSSGSVDVNTMLSVGSHPCAVMLSGMGGGFSGLSNIDGRWPNEGANPTTVRSGNLQNGRRYRLSVSARVDSDDHASVDVSLDGKRYFPNWAGNPASLGIGPVWRLPNPMGLGLGAYKSGVTFHSARLKMLSGSALLDSALISANH